MENFLVSLNAVGPLFCFLVLGGFLRKRSMIDAQLIKRMNKITHYVFLPALLFKNIIDCDLSKSMRGDLVLIAAVSSTISCLLAVGIACAVQKENPRRAALAQGMFRNNYVSFGIAIATSVYGAEAAGVVSMLIACIVPLNNIYAVTELTVFRHERPDFKKLLREIGTNPFVLAAVAGFAFSLLKLELPKMLYSTLGSISGMGVPMSMLMLGASFSFSDAGEYKKDIVIGVLTKLILLPLVFVPVYVMMGIRREALLVLLIALCTPPAASSHVMAGQMGADSKLAGHLIVFGSAASMVTIFTWLFVLKNMALL